MVVIEDGAAMFPKAFIQLAFGFPNVLFSAKDSYPRDEDYNLEEEVNDFQDTGGRSLNASLKTDTLKNMLMQLE